MNKIKLDTVFKAVVLCVAVVFVYSQFFSQPTLSEDVYGGENLSTGVVNTEVNSEVNLEEIQGSMVDGVQVIEFDLQNNAYPNLILKSNVPAKLIINVDSGVLNSCNFRIISEDLGIQQQLEEGQNIIEFTPGEAGEYIYTCWMGMIGAYVTVSDEVEPGAVYGGNVSQGGCCSY